MDARTKEAIRYLGFGRHEVDDHTLKLIEAVFKDLSQAAGPKSICQIFDLNHPEERKTASWTSGDPQ